jgi:hypothetical protein
MGRHFYPATVDMEVGPHSLPHEFQSLRVPLPCFMVWSAGSHGDTPPISRARPQEDKQYTDDRQG